ncbi:MAG: serine hydrolase [Leptospira sp.]|nr:serine hydrolase [Leptospira sp.]
MKPSRTLQISLSLLTVFIFACSLASVREGENKIQKDFESTFRSAKHSQDASFLVQSDRLNLRIKRSLGISEDGKKVSSKDGDPPFHIASIGKLFTTVLIYQMVESKRISLDEPIANSLGNDLLKDLFVYEGIDYSAKVTVKHLLSHTSGIEDYFESKDQNKKAVLFEITENPNKFWTPIDLLNFTRINQKAVAPPGKKFHYSDTGYILLGLLLEKKYKQPFESILKERILTPLAMDHTYMHLRSLPKNKSNLPLSKMMLGEADVTNFKSISCDWAGGGIVSTTEDLLLFQKALVGGKLISKETLASLPGNYLFMDGILYGNGMMTVDFSKMSIFIPSTPLLYGHSGVLGTLMFYSPEYDAHIIVNLGSTEDVGDSFELLFWIMDSLKEIHEIQKKETNSNTIR